MLVDFSLFVRFVLLLFSQGSPNRPKLKEERAGRVFFSFLYNGEKRKPRLQRTDCTILGRHFGLVSVPAYVRDKYKILMADRELAFVSGRARRLFPRVRFHFWPQRRRYSCILFLSCELPRSRSRQHSRARQRTEPLRPVNLKLDLALDLERLRGGFVLVDLLMNGFRKT